LKNDSYKPKDDISVASLLYREPRNLAILTGPPLEKKFDNYVCSLFNSFDGKKAICGGTTAGIYSRETKLKINMSLDNALANLPPTSRIEGIDLVTE